MGRRPHHWKKALNIYKAKLGAEQPTISHLLPGSNSSYHITDPNSTETNIDMLNNHNREASTTTTVKILASSTISTINWNFFCVSISNYIPQSGLIHSIIVCWR